MNWLKVFVLSYIRGYRIIERNERFITQKLSFDAPWFSWLGISRDGDLYSGESRQLDYCAVDTYDLAVAKYYNYLDEVERKKKRNKTYVHALPPMEPKAWRLLKEKNEN